MTLFRSGADDILEVMSAPTTPPPEDRITVDLEVPETNGSEEELRKLDDEE